MAKNIFESTMSLCRESKSADVKKKVASKKLTEKRNLRTRKMVKEADEDEEIDDTMSDVADDIVVVVDPDVEADEMSEVAQAFQDIIEDTDEGEIAETDEYVDDSIFGCPICGNKFFSLDDLSMGGVCPVCGEEADAFVFVGDVEATEEAETEVTDDEFADDEEIADVDFDMDGEELDIDEEEIEEGCKPKKEMRKSRRPSMEKRAMRKPLRRPSMENRTRRAVRKPSMEKRTTMRKPSTRRAVERKTTLNRKNVAERRAVRNNGLMLDEKSFNRYLTRFIRENYKNASTFAIVGAKKVNNNLKFECKIGYKSGKIQKVTLECKNFNRNSKVLAMRDNGAFKVESKKGSAMPFTFKIARKGNVITCEGMKYNFYTKAIKEGKLAQVYGSYVKESTKPSMNRGRKVASRRAMENRSMRRPSARRNVRRAVEHKAIRRPSTRRAMVEKRAIRRPSARK